MPIDRDLRRDLDACHDAHRRLVAHLEEWAGSGGDPAAASRLPGWTRGHVLSHLARNADSLVGMLEAAARGEIGDQYPSAAVRDADIAAGAGRPAAESVADVAASIDRLEVAFDRSDFEGYGRGLIVASIPMRHLPFRRQREVEYHRTDLDLGYEPEHWPHEFVRRELRRQEMTSRSRIAMGLTTWPPEVRGLDDAHRLAWLVGRHGAPGLPEAPPWN